MLYLGVRGNQVARARLRSAFSHRSQRMTLDRDTVNNILLFAITAIGAVSAAMWLGLILWTWRDMRSARAIASPRSPPRCGSRAGHLRSSSTSCSASGDAQRSLRAFAGRRSPAPEYRGKPVCPLRRQSRTTGRCLLPHQTAQTMCQLRADARASWNLCPYCAASQVQPPRLPSAPCRRLARRRTSPPPPSNQRNRKP